MFCFFTSYDPRRHRMLGNELAAAHVIVARGGKVKFMGQDTWVTDYRKDAKPGVPEEDLPVMKLELCTLPVNYDARYRLEAIDASGVELFYEGLENFGMQTCHFDVIHLILKHGIFM